jgi:selenocysteine lyase/cysteine desulfurase
VKSRLAPLAHNLVFSLPAREAVRASLYIYSTKKEIDVLVDALSAVGKDVENNSAFANRAM